MSFPPRNPGTFNDLASKFTLHHFHCILCITRASLRSTQTQGLWNQILPLDRRVVKSQNLSWSACPYVKGKQTLLRYVFLLWVVDSFRLGQASDPSLYSPGRHPHRLMYVTLEFLSMLEDFLFKGFQSNSPKP